MPSISTIEGLVGVTFTKIEYVAVASVRMERMERISRAKERTITLGMH